MEWCSFKPLSLDFAFNSGIAFVEVLTILSWKAHFVVRFQQQCSPEQLVQIVHLAPIASFHTGVIMRFMTLLIPGISHHLQVKLTSYSPLKFNWPNLSQIWWKIFCTLTLSGGRLSFHLSDRTGLTEQHSISAAGLLHYIIHKLQIASFEVLWGTTVATRWLKLWWEIKHVNGDN